MPIESYCSCICSYINYIWDSIYVWIYMNNLIKILYFVYTNSQLCLHSNQSIYILIWRSIGIQYHSLRNITSICILTNCIVCWLILRPLERSVSTQIKIEIDGSIWRSIGVHINVEEWINQSLKRLVHSLNISILGYYVILISTSINHY